MFLEKLNLLNNLCSHQCFRWRSRFSPRTSRCDINLALKPRPTPQAHDAHSKIPSSGVLLLWRQEWIHMLRFVWGSKGATLAPAARDVCSAIYRQTGKNKFKIKHRKALNTDTWFWINQANNLLMNTPFQFNLILGNIWPWYRKNVSCLQHRSISQSFSVNY